MKLQHNCDVEIVLTASLSSAILLEIFIQACASSATNAVLFRHLASGTEIYSDL